jgi:hypothetical protein
MNIVVLHYLQSAGPEEKANFTEYLQDRQNSTFQPTVLREQFVIQSVFAHQETLLERAAALLATLPPAVAACLAEGLSKIVLKPSDLITKKD